MGNKEDLTKFRAMLMTARDRVQKLKTAGKSAREAVAEKPLADLDSMWGKDAWQRSIRAGGVLGLVR